MIGRIALVTLLIISITIETSIILSSPTYDGGTIILLSILGLVDIFAGIWLYKDIIGWDKFKNPNGLDIRRK